MNLLYSARKTKLGYQATYELWDRGQVVSAFASVVRFTTRPAALDYAADLADVEATKNVFRPRVCARTSLNGKAIRRAMRKNHTPM